MTVLASAVDWGKLAQVVWTAAAAGIGVTIIFSVAVYGMAKSTDVRDEQRAASAVYALVGVLGLLASLGAAVWGLVLITSK